MLFLIYLIPRSLPSRGISKLCFDCRFQESMMLPCYQIISWFISSVCIFLTSPLSIQTSAFRELKHSWFHLYVIGWKATQARLSCICSLGLCREMLGHTWKEAHLAHLDHHPCGSPAPSWPPWLTAPKHLSIGIITNSHYKPFASILLVAYIPLPPTPSLISSLQPAFSFSIVMERVLYSSVILPFS